MTTTDWPTTENIRDIFCDEIAALDGHVESVADDGRHLYCRATLPWMEEVARGDRIRAGAALRATPACACICPWLLRILCINGIIVRQPMPEREVEMPLAQPADVAESTLRQAIAAMCSEEAFAPLAVVLKYRDFGEVVNEINNSLYGLQAGIFTNRLKDVFHAFKYIDAGGIVINDVPTYRADHQPYGGMKDSGMGREGIRYTIEDMTEIKVLVLNKLGRL